jgi:hypothetical protein
MHDLQLEASNVQPVPLNFPLHNSLPPLNTFFLFKLQQSDVREPWRQLSAVRQPQPQNSTSSSLQTRAVAHTSSATCGSRQSGANACIRSSAPSPVQFSGINARAGSS